MRVKWIALLVAFVIFGGCTTNPYTGESQTSKAATGAAIGAVAGAVIGAATSSKKDRKKGILIGAAAGGAMGGGAGYYMDVQEAELRSKLEGTGVRVVRNGNEITLVMPGNITFDSGKAALKSEFYPTLESVGIVLDEFEDTRIEVSGYTDSTGSLELNQRLSQDRAISVGQLLMSQGVVSSRVQMIGYGPKYPVASNETNQGRQANRRVELRLIPVDA